MHIKTTNINPYIKTSLKHFFLFYIVALLLSFGCTPKSQQTENQGVDYSNSDVPQLYARVNDYSNVLSNEEEKQLNKLLKSLEDSVGSQLVILLIDSLDNRTIEQYSIDVTDAWKIGRADFDDGILITLAMYDRKVRIEVGYGLELIIKDEIAKNIVDSTMVPKFQKSDFYNGLTNASKKIMDLIYHNPELIGKKWTRKIKPL